MKIIADRNFNLHSASTPGGLIHVPRRLGVVVPDDVQDQDMFDVLVKHGHIAIIDGKLSRRAMQLSRPTKAQEVINPESDGSETQGSSIPLAKSFENDDDDEDEDDDDVVDTKKVDDKKVNVTKK